MPSAIRAILVGVALCALAGAPAVHAADGKSAATAVRKPDKESRAVQDELNDVAELICGQVDWSRPELAGVAAVRKAEGARAAAVALIHHFRARQEPRLIHGSDYVRLVRSRATEEQRQRARERLEQAFGRPLARSGYHSNPFAIGTEALVLVADEGLYRRIGETVLAAPLGLAERLVGRDAQHLRADHGPLRRVPSARTKRSCRCSAG